MKTETKTELKIWVVVIVFVTLIMCTCKSCCPGEQLTHPCIKDGDIVKVEKRTVYTVNNFGYKVPHRIPRNDTTIYLVGGVFIYKR